jgi:Protein of unknown function (DUF4236)
MGFGFRKSFKVAPGVRLNVGKRGIGASVGVKGLRYSVNSRGSSRVTASIPGTGLSYTSSSSGRSYKSKAYSHQRELQRKLKEQEKFQEMERNKLEVQLFENRLEMIMSIHKECDDHVDWDEVKQRPEPFLRGERGPKENTAIKRLNNYTPGFFAKLFKQDVKRKEQYEADIVKAHSEDQAEYREWERMVQVASKILDGDIDTYFEVIDEFAPLDDLTEFGSGFEFFVEDPKVLEIDFDVQTNNVVPAQKKTLTKTGKVSVTNIPKTQYLDIQQDYICSCILRIARDMFSLLPLQYIYINALDERTNTATGHLENEVILSIKVDRSTLNNLNFDSIDCSDSMANFEHNMNFKKTKGFEKVERLVVYELNV